MNFYSIEFLEKQSNYSSILRYTIIFALLFFLIFALVLFFKNRLDTKYRDLSVILFLSLLLVAGMQYMEYSQSVNQQDQASEVLNFIDVVSKKEQVDKQDILINSTQLNDAILLMLKDSFYEVDFNIDKSAYNLKEVILIDDEIQIIDQ